MANPTRLRSFSPVPCRPRRLGPLFAAAWLAALALPALAIDLLQTYRAAVTFDPTYAAARAAYDAGVEKLDQARGGLLPSLTLSGNRARNQLDNTSAQFRTDYNSKGFTLQLSQPLFNWPVWNAYRQGQALASQSEAQLVADTQDLIVRVVETYFEVVSAQEVLDAQLALESASQEQLELSEHSLETGTATITDVDEAKARLDLATAQAITARNDLEVKLHALRELTGKEIDGVRRLRLKLGLARPQPEDLRPWVESAESENPLVRVREFAFAYADHEVRRSFGGHLPTLDVVASRQGSWNVNTLNGLPSNTMQNALMLQLSVPIFQGGRQLSKDREAVALKEKARAEWQDAQRSARQIARQSYLGVLSGLAQSIALESAVASSVSSLTGNRMGFDVGTRRNVDVLNAQSQVADAQQRLTKARIDTILAQVKLKAAVGRLSEEEILGLNALLDDPAVPRSGPAF